LVMKSSIIRWNGCTRTRDQRPLDQKQDVPIAPELSIFLIYDPINDLSWCKLVSAIHYKKPLSLQLHNLLTFLHCREKKTLKTANFGLKNSSALTRWNGRARTGCRRHACRSRGSGCNHCGFRCTWTITQANWMSYSISVWCSLYFDCLFAFLKSYEPLYWTRNLEK